MVKLIIEIKENETKGFKNIVASDIDVSIEEIGLNSTKAEIKISKLFKETINGNEKVINDCKNDETKEIIEYIKKHI